MSTAPAERPLLTDSLLTEQGVPPEEWADARADHADFCQALEARGPLHFDFGDHIVTGNIVGSDATTGEFLFVSPLAGTLDIPTYTAVQAFEGFHVDPEAIASQPMGALGMLAFRGASDELIATIGHFTDVLQLDIDAVFDQSALEEMRGYWESPEHNPDLIALPDYVCTGGSVVTDANLGSLKALTKLITFELYDSSVSDAPLGDLLAAWPELSVLSLGSTSFTGAGLAKLAGGRTRMVNIDSAALSGAAVSQLPELASITELRLCGPGIFEGLDTERLSRTFPHLERLEIGRPDLSPAEEIELRRTLPGLEINGVVMSAKAVEKFATTHDLASG